MKKLLIAITLVVLAGGAYAEDVTDLQTFRASDVRASAMEVVVPAKMEKAEYPNTPKPSPQGIIDTNKSRTEFSSGDAVLHNGSVRFIESIDNSGKIVLRENCKYSRTFTDNRSVSLVVNSFNGFSVGDAVLHNDSVRFIESLDNTGRVVLRENCKYPRTFTDNRSVSPVVNSFNGFSVGDTVIFENDVRVIKFLDNTGRVVLRESTKYYRTYTNSRSISIMR